MLHLYGFVIGIASWVSVTLIEKKAEEIGITSKLFWKIALWIGVFGFLGSRLYHVATDFQYYRYALINIFKVWNGGLSIIGTVIGALVGVILFLHFTPQKNITVLKVMDVIIFGLPVGQAIGRLGNYFNQELYGLPTSLPWGIYIDVQHRIAPYVHFERFHPLFAYEMIFTALFGIALWIYSSRVKNPVKIGRGIYFLVYVLYYCFVRFCLDFIRIDKTYFLNTSLGLNQAILIVLMSVTGVSMLWRVHR